MYGGFIIGNDYVRMYIFEIWKSRKTPTTPTHDVPTGDLPLCDDDNLHTHVKSFPIINLPLKNGERVVTIIARLAVRLGDVWVTLVKTSNVEYF